MAALRPLSRVVVSASLALLPALVYGQANQLASHAPGKTSAQGLPLVFEGNQGQYSEGISFVGRTDRYSVAIGSNDIRFALPGAHQSSQVVLSMRGGQGTQPVGLAEAPFRTNYYVGSNPANFRLGVRNYNRVGLNQVYPGIDVQFYSAGRTIEHDFLVGPGADASVIAMNLAANGRKTSLDASGNLIVKGEEGELRLNKPVAYQVDDAGKRHEVAASFVLASAEGPDHGLRFRLGEYDHSRQLVIDPVILYASFFDGQTAGSTATAIAADSSGNTYLTGYTKSPVTDFGVSSPKSFASPRQQANLVANANASAFVAKFNTPGSATAVAWLDYISGDGDVTPTSVAAPVAPGTVVAVGGSTLADDLGTTAGTAFPTVSGSIARGFVETLSSTDGTQQASTYIDSNMPGAATATTVVTALAMDVAGNVYAVGSATGGGFTVTTNAFPVSGDVLSSTAAKGYLFELTSALAPAPNTVLSPGGLITYVNGNVAADTTVSSVTLGTGVIYVGGYTKGVFPLAGTYTDANMFLHNSQDTTGNDAFAAELVPTLVGTTIAHSTWFSGKGDDQVTSIALGNALIYGLDNVYVFGQTTSDDLLSNATYTTAGTTTSPTPGSAGNPVTPAFPSKSTTGNTAGFGFRLGTGGVPMVGTYIGGSGLDAITAGAAGGDSNAYVAGYSSSGPQMSYTGSGTAVLPTGQDNTSTSSQRGFVLQLANDLSAVNFIANLGGSTGPDSVVGLGLDSSNNVYVAGNISSGSAFTTNNDFQYTRVSTSGTAAYLAEIQTAAGTALPYTLSDVQASTCTPANPSSGVTGCPDPIGYPSNVSPAINQVTYTWALNPVTNPASVPSSLKISVDAPTPAGVPLQYSSSSIKIVDTKTGTDETASSSCTYNSAENSITCTSVPDPAASVDALDPLTITVTGTLTSQPSFDTPTNNRVIGVHLQVDGNPPTLSPGTTYTPQIAVENSDVQYPASLAVTANAPSATTTYTNTPVTYTFSIANAASSAGNTVGTATTNVAIVTSLPATAYTVSYTVGSSTTSTSCTATTCTGISIPAGSSATVTITATYPDSVLSTGQKSTTGASFQVTATAFGSTPPAATSPAVTVQRGVHLTVTGETLSTSTEADGNFYLADTITFGATVQNVGPSTSNGTETVSFVLPTGFTATSVTVGSNPPSTSLCSTGTCTVTVPALGPAASITISVAGSFPDTTANASIGTKVSESFPTVTATLDASSDVDSGAGTSVTATPPGPFFIERYATLTVSTPSVSPSATVCTAAAHCLYMKNSGIGDTAPFTFTITNSAKNISVGDSVTITLPSAPAISGTNHALIATLSTPSATAPGGGFTAITCTLNNTSSAAAPAANTITCSGALPGGGGTLTVSGSLQADPNAVPAASVSTSTSATAGSVVATQTANASNNATTASPASQNLSAIEIDRAAHLVTKATATPSLTAPATKLNLDETGTAAPGANDTVTITTAVDSVPLDTVSATLSIVLPQWFRLASVPTLTSVAGVTASQCTVGGSALTLPYTTNATPATLVCAIAALPGGAATPPSGGSGAVLNTQQVKVVFSGKFLDNGAGADITGVTPTTKAASLLASLGSATVAVAPGTAVDPYPVTAYAGAANDGTTSSSTNVQRLVSMHVRKTRNSFGSASAPNLDEKTGTLTFGANDEVEYEVAIGNSGVNQAVGAQFTDMLPPYFTVTGLYPIAGASTTPDARGATPATLAAGVMVCYPGPTATGSPIALPIITGAGGQAITCTYGESSTPALAAALPANSYTTDFQSSAVELVYQGKFQDNAPGVDNIAGSTNNFTTPASTAKVSTAPYSVDPNDGETAAGPTFTVQRSAHLTLTSISAVTDANTYQTVTAAGVAQPSTTSGSYVFNCVRYTAILQNTGHNISRAPQMSVSLPFRFILRSVEFAPVSSLSGVNTQSASCSFSTTSTSISTAQTSNVALQPTSETTANSGVLVDFDGYFATDALSVVKANSTTAALTYTTLQDPGVVDPGPAITLPTAPSITVVNTPYGSSFTVVPYSTTATQPAVVTFATVTAPGATTLVVGGSSSTMPQGTSSDPRYTSKMNLYRPGYGTPQSYSMGTSATVTPNPGGTPNTTVCFTNGSAALPDTFVKPERVLLWALSGLPNNTTPNTFPKGNISSPYTGDITTSVTPMSGTAKYVQADYYGPTGSATTPTFPAVQVQPQMICGQVDGFAPAATPTVFQALEPINLPPLVNAPTAVTQTPGKGVSEVSYLFPTAHDYNDSDPCYISNPDPAGTGTVGRYTCDDNRVLSRRILGAEALLGKSYPHVWGPFAYNDTTLNAVFEVEAGATFYEFPTDQIGELNYQDTSGSITGAGSTSPCDPGVQAAGYTIVNGCPTETVATLSGSPLQGAVLFSNTYKTQAGVAGADIAQLVPSVNGGSSSLIVLPPADNPQVIANNPATGYTVATASINPGQTVGFLWRLSAILTNTEFDNITCFQVDAATKSTKTAFATGVNCSTPGTATTPNDPAIYVSTQSGVLYGKANGTGWRVVGEAVFAGLLIPFLLFRRRFSFARQLVIFAVLSLGVAAGLTGCGTGSTTGAGGTTTVTPAGTYWFRVSGVAKGSATTYYSTAFSVTVSGS